MPETVPRLSGEEVRNLGKLPENGAFVRLLDMYLDLGITAWDLDFSVGRRWVRARELDRRTVLVQCWHNPEGELSYILRFLSERLGCSCGFWAKTCVKLAVMGMLLSRMEQEETDLAVLSGDFSGVLAEMKTTAPGNWYTWGSCGPMGSAKRPARHLRMWCCPWDWSTCCTAWAAQNRQWNMPRFPIWA